MATLRYARSVLDRGLDPRGKRAALHAPAGTSPADNAVLDDLTLDHHLDHLASLCEPRSGDPGATAPTRLSTGLAPAGLAPRTWWWLLER